MVALVNEYSEELVTRGPRLDAAVLERFIVVACFGGSELILSILSFAKGHLREGIAIHQSTLHLSCVG